jgi:hypothetical protein
MTEVAFRDEWATCGDCGNRFVFGVSEQRTLAESGRLVNPPSLCRRCRRSDGAAALGSWEAPGADRGRGSRQSRGNGNARVYVGRLSYDTGEDALRRLFDSVGTVQSVEVIRDRHTGWSRGFAFVEMTTTAGAQRAIRSLNGAGLDGRQIKVAEARPRRSPSLGNHVQGSW